MTQHCIPESWIIVDIPLNYLWNGQGLVKSTKFLSKPKHWVTNLLSFFILQIFVTSLVLWKILPLKFFFWIQSSHMCFWRFCVLYWPPFPPLNLINRTALTLKTVSYICWALLLIDVPAVLCSFEVKGTVQPKNGLHFTLRSFQNSFISTTEKNIRQDVCPAIIL